MLNRSNTVCVNSTTNARAWTHAGMFYPTWTQRIRFPHMVGIVVDYIVELRCEAVLSPHLVVVM